MGRRKWVANFEWGDIDKSGGDWTYIGHLGNTVLDYAIANEKGKGEIEQFQIEDSVLSDHQPLDLTLKCETEIEREVNKEAVVRVSKFKWEEQQVEEYQNRIIIDQTQEMGREIEDIWENLKQKINKARVKEKIVVYDRNTIEPGWWDKECTKLKKLTRKNLRQFKKESNITKREELKQVYLQNKK